MFEKLLRYINRLWGIFSKRSNECSNNSTNEKLLDMKLSALKKRESIHIEFDIPNYSYIQNKNFTLPKIFQFKNFFDDDISLKKLKILREKKEAIEQKILNQKINAELKIFESCISHHCVSDADSSLKKVLELKSKIKNQNELESLIASKRKVLEHLKYEIQKENEEQIRQNNIESKIIQKLKDFDDYVGKRMVEEASIVLSEINDFLIELKNKSKYQKQVDERSVSLSSLKETIKKESDRLFKIEEEKKRLISLCNAKKSDADKILQILNDNDIKCFYHFTDEKNLNSIKKYGGLLSWYYCENNSIFIPRAGGDMQSRRLDRKYGLQDYVRLSFCKQHPMAYRLVQGKNQIVILKISTEVALIESTQFSNMNATDKLHTHGSSIENLKSINFEATQNTYLSSVDGIIFKQKQAEVMVKTFIPLKYILNIDDPIQYS